VHNNIIAASCRSKTYKQILILLPRCLLKDARERITSNLQQHVKQVFVCGGGDAARKHIHEEKPEAVIAVACERDLLAGILEMGKNIPIFAVPNQRPEGPCLHTRIQNEDLEEAVQVLLGKSVVSFQHSKPIMQSDATLPLK
jgi:uncharacterized protein